MASHFVSGGTIGPSGEAASHNDADGGSEPRATPLAAAKRKSEWEAVQLELEAERKRRDEARLKAATGGEKSLYDILQANKAAKQAAFEEKHKLKNQFRPLDDDEADFLDEVRERMRRDEERVRRETEEGLRAFRRRQQGEGDDGDGGNDDDDDDEPQRRLQRPGATSGAAAEAEEEWGTGGRKRKRGGRDRDARGLVRRKVVGGAEAAAESDGGGGGAAAQGGAADTGGGRAAEHGKAEERGDRAAMALVDYGSDDGD